MDKSEKKLWELYEKTQRKELLEKLVDKYIHIVKIISIQLKGYTTYNMNEDDIYSAGLIGLMQAIENFDYKKGYEFSTYASQRIRGEIIDEIRRTDWVPRSVRAKVSEIKKVITAYRNKKGYMPNDEDIADEMGISLQEYYKYIDSIGPLFLSSLNSPIGSSGDDGKNLKLIDVVEDPNVQDEEKKLILSEIRNELINFISELESQEKIVISLYYYEELNLKEIGIILELSESRVSQIHSSALLKLREMLEESFSNINFS